MTLASDKFCLFNFFDVWHADFAHSLKKLGIFLENKSFQK